MQDIYKSPVLYAPNMLDLERVAMQEMVRPVGFEERIVKGIQRGMKIIGRDTLKYDKSETGGFSWRYNPDKELGALKFPVQVDNYTGTGCLVMHGPREALTFQYATVYTSTQDLKVYPHKRVAKLYRDLENPEEMTASFYEGSHGEKVYLQNFGCGDFWYGVTNTSHMLYPYDSHITFTKTKMQLALMFNKVVIQVYQDHANIIAD